MKKPCNVAALILEFNQLALAQKAGNACNRRPKALNGRQSIQMHKLLPKAHARRDGDGFNDHGRVVGCMEVTAA